MNIFLFDISLDELEYIEIFFIGMREKFVLVKNKKKDIFFFLYFCINKRKRD